MKEQRTEEGMKAKIDYITNWKKENVKTFSATIKKEEWDEITNYLNSINMNKAEFIRYAYELIKSKNKH